MQCPKCGALLAEGSRFCPYCSSILEKSAGETQNEAFSGSDETLSVPDRQPSYGGWDPYGDNRPLSTVSDDPRNDPRGMKWFKFIIYFQLFANAAVNGISALMTATGAQYQGQADKVYAALPRLRTLDLVYILLLLGLVVLAIVTRMQLARFRRRGPLLYYLLQIANLAVAVLYLLAASAISGVPLSQLDLSNTIISLGLSLVMLIINIIYFGNRKDLFVN